MTKPKQIDPIPDEFSSYEEAGKFWDSHDTTDYPGAFRTITRGKRRRQHSKYWKNSSILKLSGDRDPVSVITERAQDVVFKAMEEGWTGPPFDPFALAGLLNIKVVPRTDLGQLTQDARIVPGPGQKLTIEYNPDKSPSRIRFSICHEIAHSFFPNCGEQVRNRFVHGQIQETDRELELLCNLGAAELLMPIGSFRDVARGDITIDRILDLRKKYLVSTEAVLLRTVKLANEPIGAFSAVAKDFKGQTRYAIEYFVSSNAWDMRLQPGFELPEDTAISRCLTVGDTMKASEIWEPTEGRVDLEAVGVATYSNLNNPKPSDFFGPAKKFSAVSNRRIVGFLRPSTVAPGHRPKIVYLKRDVTSPVDTAPTIVAHVVNDKTPNWGAGFGMFVRKKWPAVQDAFRETWLRRGRLSLGDIVSTQVTPALTVVQMVAQHGYGRSPKPLLRYEHLRQCLHQLAKLAIEGRARVQMPRIGSGEAGGSWPVIEEMIEDILCRKNVHVTVCDLPGTRVEDKPQLELIEQPRESA